MEPTPEARTRAEFVAAAGSASVIRWRTQGPDTGVILTAVAQLTSTSRHLAHGPTGQPALYCSRVDTKPGTPRTIVAITPGDHAGIEAAIDQVMAHPHHTPPTSDGRHIVASPHGVDILPHP